MATTEDVIAALWRAARATETHRRLPPGMRRSHMYVLVALDELGGEARVSAVADHARILVPNIGRLLRETGEMGLTERRADPDDARAVRAALTDAGRATAARYHHDHLAAIDAELRPGDDPRFDEMIATLDRTIAVLNQVTERLDARDSGGAAP